MKTALFVGRFQPFHKGHEHVLKSLFKRFDKVIIAIGSTNKMNRENPFSIKERKEMVENVLSNCKGKYRIVAIPDVIDDNKWTKSILKKARFDVAVIGNTWTKKCFERFGIRVIKPRFIKEKTYNATRIRKLIRENKNWKHLVPKSVAPIIEKSLP